jgi:hypothetical protein
MNNIFISIEEGLIEVHAHGTFVRFASGPPSPPSTYTARLYTYLSSLLAFLLLV